MRPQHDLPAALTRSACSLLQPGIAEGSLNQRQHSLCGDSKICRSKFAIQKGSQNWCGVVHARHSVAIRNVRPADRCVAVTLVYALVNTSMLQIYKNFPAALHLPKETAAFGISTSVVHACSELQCQLPSETTLHHPSSMYMKCLPQLSEARLFNHS